MKKYAFLFIVFALLIPICVSAQSKFDVQSIVQVQIVNKEGVVVSWGSGINIGAGSILTNYHVAKDVIEYPNTYMAIVCATKSGEYYPDCSYAASAYYQFSFEMPPEYSEELDLAVLNINWKYVENEWKEILKLPLSELYDLHVIDLSIYDYDLSSLAMGDEVQTLGYPAYNGGLTITYTTGEVNAFSYDLWPVKGFTGINGVGITAPIGHGSSGGAALDEEGNLLGITTQCSYGLADEEICSGGYIVSVNAINWWWEQVLGHKVSNWFGYTYGAIPEQTLKEANCLVGGKIYNQTLDKCICDQGYIENSKGDCIKSETLLVCPSGQILNNGQCVTYDSGCKSSYGQNSVWIGNFETDGRYICGCKDGYNWNDGNTLCVAVFNTNTISPIEQAIAPDMNLTKKMAGYILLQVESHGEAWYVEPKTSQRYYMKDGATAYQMMRSFGLGITDFDLEKMQSSNSTDEIINATSICSSNPAANRLKGKILLQVEQHGEAYYVYPKNCRMIYMKDGDAAYQIMRYLGLGITNADLEKIQANE